MRLLAAALVLLAGPASGQEARLIDTLRSSAPLQQKAEACKELARVGGKAAVPILASLLPDEQLSDMARYALEPIADPSVDAALRPALKRCHGRQLVGVVASLGVRKDRQAVAPLAALVAYPDGAVTSAAARALGSIGPAAAPALKRALASAPTPMRPAVCEGLFRCAEQMAPADAYAVYDWVRGNAGLPKHIREAALGAAIRSRGPADTSLLQRTLRTGSLDDAARALRISMDLPGSQLTRTLVDELSRVDVGRQALIVRALGLRNDPTAAASIEHLARRAANTGLRAEAIRSLAQLGSVSSVRPLLALLTDADRNIRSEASLALIGFRGRAADDAVAAQLGQAGAPPSVALIEVAGQRRVRAAVPALLTAAGSADRATAAAAFKALGLAAGPQDIPATVEAMGRAADVPSAESALTAICARQDEPAECADRLLPGILTVQGEAKLALLRVLAGVGGPRALTAMRAAAAEPAESVRDTAVRLLCDWPTADALPDLVNIGKAADPTLRILVLRGQLRLIPIQSSPVEQRVGQVRDLLPSAERREERLLALSALAAMPCASALALITPYLSQEGLREEAAQAAVSVAEKIVASNPAEVAETLRQVQTGNAELAARVRAVLARVPAGGVEAGFTPIFNGRDLTGWSTKPGWWHVEDGALTAESTSDKPCKECNYLIWQGGQPGDFELLAEFKLSKAGNSGIQIRSEERPDWDTFGYQADMTGDGELVGYVYHHARGLVAARGERAVFDAAGKKTVVPIAEPAELLKRYKVEDWNTYRVVCRGPEIALYINGALMCHITDHQATAAAKGIIALQMHPGPPMKVQFRNICIKELK